MEYETTVLTNTLVNKLIARFNLDASSSTILNMLILKGIVMIRKYDMSKLYFPPVARKFLELMTNNIKYFIVLYAIKYITEHKTSICSAIQSIKNQPTENITSDDPSNKNMFVIDISNITKSIDTIHKFIGLHPEFFQTNICYKLVIIGDNPEPYQVYGEPLYFVDQVHGVEGYIETQFTTTIDHKNNTVQDYTMRLHIKKNIDSKYCYITQLEQYVSRQTKMGKVVNLYYYKIMPRNLIINNFYNESVDRWQIDIKYLTDSYFCEHKDFLFSIMQNKMGGNLVDSTGWNNLILHGAPGTGKSSIIYRIATLMKRSIVSVDLSLYLDKKRELYNLFYGQSFQLPSDEKKVTIADNSIIVLEEFDNTIRKLLSLEKIHVLKQDLIESDFKNKQNSLLYGNDKSENINENDTSMGRPKEKINVNKVSHEIDQAIHSNKLNVQNDTLRIFDLLELFQGVVSPPSRMIIATTNYYDEIKQSLPSLFRPGRLSELEFKYLSWDLLNNLSDYYFQKPITIEPRVVTIPTAQIVELALKYKINHDHDGFLIELENLLDKKLTAE